MSSEEETDSMSMQDKLLKKTKRTRQRVDAGEPRNSYASIPNFCSRPNLHLPNGINSSSGNKMLNEFLGRQLKCDIEMGSDSTVDSTDIKMNGVAMQLGSVNGNSDSNLASILRQSTESPPPGMDRSQLLREILQGKKQEHFESSGNSFPPNGKSNSFPNSSSIISQLLKGSTVSGHNNGVSTTKDETNEIQHNDAGTLVQESSDESEENDKPDPILSSESQQKMNGGDRSLSPTCNSPLQREHVFSPHLASLNDAEIKRARVENIVSSMRSSPSRTGLDNPQVNGCKKRKQYQPQQHEAVRFPANSEEPAPKHRKVERETLRKQLQEIQQQLVEMQQRYFELYEAESSDSDVVGSSQSEDGQGELQIDLTKPVEPLDAAGREEPIKTESPMSLVHDALNKEAEQCEFRPVTSTETGCHSDLDPAHFIDQARRLVSEQEKLAKEASNKFGDPEAKFPFISRNPQPLTVEVDSFAEILKTELTASLAAIIDTIVARFLQRRALNKPTDSNLTKDILLTNQILDRRSPRTKVIDRGRINSNGFSSSSPFPENHAKPPLPTIFTPTKPPVTLYNHPPPPTSFNQLEMPEQSEAISLVVNTPNKKKRHKVTDTRITPRTVSRILNQEPDTPKYPMVSTTHSDTPYHPPPLVPVSLPTSVAIPNPSLHQSDVFSSYPYYHARGGSPTDGIDDEVIHTNHSFLHSSMLPGQNSPDQLQLSQLKSENGEGSDCNSVDIPYDGSMPVISFTALSVNCQQYSSTLTPMHLRKAKLMFFYVRYPSSAILKMYFPDIKFNKNNTAQLVKWFSNFREFYYIQMEKYARQAMSEGAKNAEDLTVGADSELYRVLNLHYNRNNHIEVPANFRYVVEQTLREFFKAIISGKDQEQSWKKSIYKVIARLDDNLPEYFKSPNFLEQLE